MHELHTLGGCVLLVVMIQSFRLFSLGLKHWVSLQPGDWQSPNLQYVRSHHVSTMLLENGEFEMQLQHVNCDAMLGSHFGPKDSESLPFSLD